MHIAFECQFCLHGRRNNREIFNGIYQAFLHSLDTKRIYGLVISLPQSNGMDFSSPYGIYVPNWRSHQPVKRKEKSTMKIIRVGVDLAKNDFQVHGVDRNEKPVWKRKLNRDEWIRVLLEKIEPGCEIGMEACGGAHHWARKLQAHGNTVKLIAPPVR
jgi:hypothetical protein